LSVILFPAIIFSFLQALVKQLQYTAQIKIRPLDTKAVLEMQTSEISRRVVPLAGCAAHGIITVFMPAAALGATMRYTFFNRGFAFSPLFRCL
jgi:hypothetical protein